MTTSMYSEETIFLLEVAGFGGEWWLDLDLTWFITKLVNVNKNSYSSTIGGLQKNN